ncbi:right-handed parallel beta-helix repeat-containing protein [Opitutus sp. ER46]|uniref:right-handed parallel beta-helix repeat-containing protein n=1 Tax=Opitutus sp. ER46 TaxID=2161864 RepID=UPI001304B886|nr:right-handed parallel beta-helix repeat-containing protein [Opitutus sp. ER46]
MKPLLPLLLCLAVPPASGTTFHAAPDGAVSQPGTLANAPTTLAKAAGQLRPGDTVILHGGRYALTQTLVLASSGQPGAPLTLEAAPGEHPIIDGSALAPSGSARAITITGNYYVLRGLEITGAYNQGVFIQGSHNQFERCVSHHNGGSGFSVTLEHGETGNAAGERAAFNRFVNCDAHHNFDWYKTRPGGAQYPGTDADGFGCSLSSGQGNSFFGCRSWSNSDDGWDCFESGYGVVIENCWTWSNGVWSDHAEVYQARTGKPLTETLFRGDGNGFKLGGNHSTGGGKCSALSRGTNVLRNGISFGNRATGIDQNNHQDGMYVENCLSFDNRRNINFWNQPNPGRRFVFRNNVLLGRGTAESAIKIPHLAEANTWQGAITATPADFVSLDRADAAAPRHADGSLPDRFGRLRPSSRLIDAGARTEAIADRGYSLPPIPYRGAAPDVGPYETP